MVDRHAHDAEETLGCGIARVDEIAGPREYRRHELARVCQSFLHLEPSDCRCTHLDGGHAYFAVALRKMPVAGREETALFEDREEQFRAFGQLLDVEIAAVLAWRHSSQTGEAARAGRHRTGSVWRKRKTAPVDHALLAGRPFSKFFVRRRHPGNPHERPAGDAHTRDLRRGRPAVADLPMHQKRLGHHIAQKTQAWHYHAEGDRLRDDVGEFDLEDVARCGALDKDRPRQWVYRTCVERGKI